MNICSHDCVVIDRLNDVWDAAVNIILAEVWVTGGLVDVIIDKLNNNMETMSVGTDVIDLEFVTRVSCDVDVITGEWVVAIIGLVTGIDADTLAEMSANDLAAAVMTVLGFALPAPREE